MIELSERLLAHRTLAPVDFDVPVPLADVPTPALLLDEDALNRNIARMADFLGARGKGFRPHAKTHKCPQVAQRQLAAGAVGICAAKVSEAIVLARAGFGPILDPATVGAFERKGGYPYAFMSEDGARS